MATAFNQESEIERTERGLIIAGTRITLYDVMDYFTAGYPAKLIREKLGLTDAQIDAALSYIETHQAEVIAEYQEVLLIAEDNRQYWEERNREHFARLAAKSPQPGQDTLRAKLQAWKDRLESKV
ncbi:DUF433 domain-containing protein [Chroococcidiopsis thermalis]|uniref:DUF433 domain-containing protein n=1 Tax=Chroococcidiopsis thermalis (strain PCC 7203) TaxID=251229 RepID=K9TWY2_CHRTP|nr:DUF433 domain-containing protein [Chroococcidiopsis thermalis]AFY86893.1 protein of unknown function DUF433 [Chroococcidiopsis thermalis PCC 7203]PSB45921.1 DUF433 domain-containing protein [Cyanosarcina cf. burmensis CCALA 770]